MSTMPLTPYDTGAVCEPRPWIDPNAPLSEPSDYDRFGRVDFEDDEGATVATVRVVRTQQNYQEHCYRLDVDRHGTTLIGALSEDTINKARNILSAADNHGTAGTPAKVREMLRAVLDEAEGMTA